MGFTTRHGEAKERNHGKILAAPSVRQTSIYEHCVEKMGKKVPQFNIFSLDNAIICLGLYLLLSLKKYESSHLMFKTIAVLVLGENFPCLDVCLDILEYDLSSQGESQSTTYSCQTPINLMHLIAKIRA